MKRLNARKKFGWLLVGAILTATIGIPLKAQSQATAPKPTGHHHYKLLDMGSLGGPGGGIIGSSSRVLNNQGMVVGASDTPIPDPFAPDCYLDCSVLRGLLLHNGVVSELPALPSAPSLSSVPTGINSSGQTIGQAQNGAIDPSTGWPETRAVLWQGGRILAIPTLGGSQAVANSINNLGQVVGATLTATSDPFANSPLPSCMVVPEFGRCGGATFSATTVFFPATTETHAFLWQQGTTHDLGTLGGPDSDAWVINDRGEVAGWSFTSFMPNASTGVPTVDPFFWDPVDGKMIDIGSFGGTFGSVFWLNNRGQVAGASNLPGDGTQHPFIWSKSMGMQDLGALGGTFGHPDWINEEGDVVGFATIANDVTGHGFLWHNGVMTDLGTLGTDPFSEAVSINSKGQIVGGTFILGVADLRGFLWENGGPMVDLNALVLPGSDLYVESGALINDRGEIACIGITPNGDSHPCILIPCDEEHSNIAGCDYSLVGPGVAEAASAAQLVKPVAPTSTAISQPSLTPAEQLARIRSMLAARRGRFRALPQPK